MQITVQGSGTRAKLTKSEIKAMASAQATCKALAKSLDCQTALAASDRLYRILCRLGERGEYEPNADDKETADE